MHSKKSKLKTKIDNDHKKKRRRLKTQERDGSVKGPEANFSSEEQLRDIIAGSVTLKQNRQSRDSKTIDVERILNYSEPEDTDDSYRELPRQK